MIVTEPNRTTESSQEGADDYGASSIQVLEGLEAVRKRPGMYIGSTGPRGLHHLVWEVVDNAVDEALVGHCDTISVTIRPDNSICVQDNGRGIPVDFMPQYQMPALEVVMTKLHAGGKFSKSSYKVSGGLHGVGISVVNALSSKLEVTVVRNGSAHSMAFSRGVKVNGITTSKPTFDKGTRVTFTPDPVVFEELVYDYDVLATRLRELAFLNSGLRIIILDERSGETDTFRYEGGIAQFVSYISEGKQPIHEPIAMSAEDEDVTVDVAVQYNLGFSETVFSFVNNINTIEGGTHLSGFRAALTRAINQYLTRYMPKEAKQNVLSGADVREGLAAIISVKVPEPQFEGQTKTKLGNSEVQGIVSSAVFSGLTTYFDEHPSEARAIVEKCLGSARARQAAQKARELVRRKSVLESSSLPGKLGDCSTRNRDKAELYIVEGDSAGGCFSGDTKVSLADGRELSFVELVREYEAGRQHHCYTISANGSIGIGRIAHPRITKRNAQVITLTLDNGRTITCTPDHRFMLRDGSYRRADELSSEDSLMPLYRQVSRKGRFITIDGYEMVFDPLSERWLFTHVLADEHNLETKRYTATSGSHRHHLDFNKRNNDPYNIVRLEADEHLAIHRAHAHRTLHTPEVLSRLATIRRTPSYRRKVSASLKRRSREFSLRAKAQWSDDAYKSFMKVAWKRYYDSNASYREAVKSRLHRAQESYWSDEKNRLAQSERVKRYFKYHPEARQRLRERAHEQWSDENLRKWRSQQTSEQWTDSFRDQRRSAYDRTYRSFSFDLLRTLYEITGSVDETTYERMRQRIGHPNILRYDTFVDRFYGSEQEMKSAVECYNHKVISVTAAGCADVYDLEVPGTHNFALSAGVFVHNSAKQARSRDFQAILPLRGKILNVEKSHLSKAIRNKEIQALITAIGTSIGDDFDLTKLRYGKIVIMTDADVDGAHIRTLLLTFFFRFMPELIENGKIYIAQPPLYKVSKGRSSSWLYSDAQLADFLEEHPGYQIQRYKGLGEMNPNQLWDTTMDPEVRKMLQVTVEDAIYADKLFTILMGSEVEPRRAFIEKHALEVENLDL
jgi:DNA gyrase subunit B